MNLGDSIRGLRDNIGLTQGQLARDASVSQGYLSQLENGDVKSPSAAILLRVARAIHVNPDELFEAAGYSTGRTMRETYRSYESTIEPTLLQYLARLPRDRQRRLLLLLEGMGELLQDTNREGGVDGFRWGDEGPDIGHGGKAREPRLTPVSSTTS